MKFPVDKCWDCELDLTTAEPADVTYPGNEQALGTCPKCGKLYFMLEVTPPEPVADKPKKGKGKSEPEPEVEPEVEPGEDNEPPA